MPREEDFKKIYKNINNSDTKIKFAWACMGNCSCDDDDDVIVNDKISKIWEIPE